MTQITSLLEIIRRLTGALHLLRLAEEVIPTLVSRGVTTAENAAIILGQIPSLRADIDEQVANAKSAMRSIHDRIEALAQFILLHRTMLTERQSEELERHLKTLRGEGSRELANAASAQPRDLATSSS